MKSENAVLNILMADDDEDDCILVRSAFQEIGMPHDLRFVADGEELLNYLLHQGNFTDHQKHPRPDLILLDLNMPLIDGREALARIKSYPGLAPIPILILTTSKDQRDIALSREAGASSFLSKPEVFEDLTEMLSRFCAAIRRNPQIPFQVIGCDSAPPEH